MTQEETMICKKCLLPQPLDYFPLELHKNRNQRYRRKVCKLCRNQYKQRNQWGLTEEQHKEMLAQGCAICGTTEGGARQFHIDHDHKTGKIRGLLCFACNITLGRLKENKNTLQNMITYLEKHES